MLLSEDAREWFTDKWGKYVSFNEFQRIYDLSEYGNGQVPD